MTIKLFKEPQVTGPVMIACWPGIGNIGLVATKTLRETLRAEEFGEIEPWEFFYPEGLTIRNGILQDLQFPDSKFYFVRAGQKDLIFFIGEEQPAGGPTPYASGKKAYRMANLVLDVAVKLGCKRIYTSGAAVVPIHHTSRPRVWAVPNTEDVIGELRLYENTILMSDIEGGGGQGDITGLNGLLLGVAKERRLEAICLMGEIPIYLHGFPVAYPKASKSVLEVLAISLGIGIEMEGIERLIELSEEEIGSLYDSFPSEIKEQLDKLQYVTPTEPTEPGPITEEDKKKILEDIDKFFKKEPEGH